MFVTRKQTSVVGVDIESGSIAAAEVSVNGVARLGAVGITPLGPGVMRDGEVVDPDALGTVLKDLFEEHKLPRSVRIGIANQRVVVRTVRMPLIEKPSELESAIRFQAAEQIPMPLEQAVLDWRVAESDPALRQSQQMDVVLVAARRDAITGFTNALRVAGLKPVGIDLAAFAMIRALSGELPPVVAPSLDEHAVADDSAEPPIVGPGPARLFCNLGDVTNLAVARGSTCLFTRVSTFGVEGIAQRLAERRELTLEHARMWLAHVGLQTPVEAVEGDPEVITVTRETLTEGAGRLAGELRLSLDYYGRLEGAVAVEEIVVCGAGTVIPGLAERLQRELGYAIRVGRPAPLGDLEPSAAARLTLPYGLALEE